ncbi:MAG: hypothetical protein Tp1124DCM412261_39 [Prokaryotic dsDNA virus sp.]|nr:MAG: hypothetical protein Tp1123DCM939791_39 [Prokaryotic dsDNA virus sp.]QDP59871.1 MAG: hypothetical protein Tp1124DCM412261_39 [Prokaryotic dsDNA virus sp.]|tara:strand:+ start:18873 stop:19493 length:621 start_codon:yes stop_codon:yes gene_type:complete
MNWKKLVDRCSLFVDGNRNLLLNLLHEAEEELTRSCNIFEDFKEYTIDATNQNVISLPSENESMNDDLSQHQGSVFKKAIVVLHNGLKLKAMHEYDFTYDSTNSRYNGTPIGYSIKNDILNLSHIPRIGDKIKIVYYGIVYDHEGLEPSIPIQFHKDLCHYACFMATIKTNPNLASVHMQLWTDTMNRVSVEEGDRDLVYTVREEI